MDPLGYPVNKWQVFLFVLVALNGLSFMIEVPTSAAIDGSFPTWKEQLYGLFLFLGGVCVLAGIYWPWHDRDALLVKRFGYLALMFSALIYGFAVIIYQKSTNGVFTGSIAITFAAISLDTVLQINDRVRFLQKEVPDAESD